MSIPTITRTAALAQAINNALPTSTLPAQQGATARNTAQQFPLQKKGKSNPPLRTSPKPLRPNQLTAARLLLAGHSVSTAAAALKIHPYTLSRWKRNPAFQAELRRQVDSLARNTAQQKPTPRNNPSPKIPERTHLPFWQIHALNPSR
jgi:hypothetical protein